MCDPYIHTASPPGGDYFQVRVCALLAEGMLYNKVPVNLVSGSEVKDDRVKMLKVYTSWQW